MSNDKKPSSSPGQGDRGGHTGDRGGPRAPATGTGTGTRSPNSGPVIKGNVPTNSGGPRRPEGGSKK
jgi:hypothetical protein